MEVIDRQEQMRLLQKFWRLM